MTALEATRSKAASGVARSGRLFVLGSIECADLDGGNRRVIIRQGAPCCCRVTARYGRLTLQ
jgi:hypothetical protein